MPSSRHHPEAPPQLNDLSFEQIEAIFQTGETLSIGKSQIVKNCTIEGTQYILKQYNASGPFTALRLAMGLSRAHHSYRFATYLSDYKINCPRHLAVISDIGPLKSSTYLIMEKAPGTPLFFYIQKNNTLPLSTQAIQNVVDLIIKLQQAGIAHGDLHTRNLIIAPNDQVQIIDLDSARFAKNRREKDLLRFTQALQKGHQHHTQILTALKNSSLNPTNSTHSLQKPL